jgi:hypothetical protein
MFIHVMVYVIHVMVYVYLFNVCMICESILEVDFMIEDQNTFEDDPHDTFDQGKWILPLHF